MVVPPESAAQLQRMGLADLGVVLGADEVVSLRAELEERVRGDGVASNPCGLLRHNLWTRLPTFAALIADGRLSAAACGVLGLEEVVLFQDNLVWKPPHTAGAIHWHQDFAYWPLDRPDGVTLWLALDDTDRHNGCLGYLLGSHHGGECQATDFIDGANHPRHTHLPVFDAAGRSERAFWAEAPAGALLAHHPLVWHTSPPNGTDGDRRAWSVTFLSPDVCWDPGHAPHPVLYERKPRRGDRVTGDRWPRFRGAVRID